MLKLYKNMQWTEFAWRITHNENIYILCNCIHLSTVYFTTLLVSPTIVWNGRMTDKWWIGEDLEGTSHGLIQVLSHYTPAETDTLQSWTMSWLRFELGTFWMQKRSSTSWANLLGIYNCQCGLLSDLYLHMLLKHGLYLNTNEQRLSLFERKVLQCVFGVKQENGTWRKRYNYELYEIFNEPNIVNYIKVKRLA
jgi:hypothetical protein